MEQVQMLTSKPLAGSVKQQAIPYGTSPDVNKQALGKLILTEQVQMLTSKPLAGSVKKQAIVGADLMAMCPKVAHQSAPHIQPSRPVGFRWAKICQSPDGNALFQLMCPKVSRPTVGSDPDGNALFHPTYL